MPVVRPYRAQQQIQPVQTSQRGRVPIGQLQTPILNVNPTPAAFGAAAGETARALGSQMFSDELRFQEAERIKADNARFSQEQRLVQDFELKLHDPQTGMLNRQGQGAINLTNDVSAEYDKFTNERAAELPNDRLRQAYSDFSAQRKAQILLPVAKYEAAQVKTFHESEWTATMANSLLLAEKNADDPVRLLDERRVFEKAADDLATSKALGPEARQTFKTQAVSGFHKNIIESLSAVDDRQAVRYFTDMKDELLPDDRESVTKLLNLRSTDGEVQRAADVIRKASPKATQQEWLEEAAKITNPDIRKDVEDRLRMYHSVRSQDDAAAKAVFTEQARAAADRVKAVWDRFEIDAEKKLDAGLPIDAVKKLPGYSDAPHETKMHVLAYANSITKEGGIDTDYSVYYDLMREANNDPQKFLKHNLFAEFGHKLNPKVEMKQLQELQNSIKTRNTAEVDKQIDGVRTNERIINGTLRQIGIDPDDKTNKARVDQLWNRVDKQVLQLQRDTGKKATNDDIQGIVDRQLIEIGGEPGSWWNILPGGEPFFDQPGKRLFELGIQDVPPADRKTIEYELRRAHREVTEGAILNLYIQTQQQLQQQKKKTGGP